MLIHSVSLCAHNNLPIVHFSFFILHVRFLLFISFVRRFSMRQNLSERTELHARYNLFKVKLTIAIRSRGYYLSLIFFYSGPAVTFKNGRFPTGFVRGIESRLQQEDRLAYRDYTHHGESNIGGSRLLNVNRRISSSS